jgi:hypothetical protein
VTIGAPADGIRSPRLATRVGAMARPKLGSQKRCAAIMKTKDGSRFVTFSWFVIFDLPWRLLEPILRVMELLLRVENHPIFLE